MDSPRRLTYTAAMLKNKRNTGLAAVWLLFVIVILSVFLAKKDTILGNLAKTDFFGKVFGRTPEFINSRAQKTNGTAGEQAERAYSLPDERYAPLDLDAPRGTDEPSRKIADGARSGDIYAELEMDARNAENATLPADAESLSAFDAEAAEDSARTAAAKITISPEREAALCFIVIDSDGTVSRKIVKRNLPKSDSPLADAINALLAGPLQSEQDKNCMTLIPPGVRLLGASVKDGVALLNFSETFDFNPLGIEGVIAQLMQVVYTATEFSTVKSVQFLIEGVRKDYLGSEGQWIGTPLARSSF